MSNPTSLCFFYELSNSSFMEVNEDKTPYMQNNLQGEETSLGKRKICKLFYNKTHKTICLGVSSLSDWFGSVFQSQRFDMLTASVVETEDEREVKRIAFSSQEPLEEEEEDIDMIEEDPEREDHIDNNEITMEDNVLEEEYVVDFYGFFWNIVVDFNVFFSSFRNLSSLGICVDFFL